MPVGPGALEAGEERVHHGLVPLEGEDEGDVDADARGEGLGDGRQPLAAGGDLDEEVGAVHEPPQRLGLGDGEGAVGAQARVDLDRDPAVEGVGAVVHRPQDIARPPDVVGREGAHRFADVDVAEGQVADLLVVRGSFRQGLLEDRRVGRDADDVPGLDELREVAGAEPLTGQVVQPHGDARCGQVGEGIGHVGTPWVCGVADQFPVVEPRVSPSLLKEAWAAATARSAVSPNCSYRTV